METRPKSKEWFKKPIFVIPIILIVVWFILPDSTKSMMVSLFGVLIFFAIAGGFIYGIVLLAKSGKKGADAVRAAEKFKLQQPEIQLWNSLGTTIEEREKGINKLFDSNKGTVYFGTRWDLLITDLSSPSVSISIRLIGARSMVAASGVGLPFSSRAEIRASPIPREVRTSVVS